MIEKVIPTKAELDLLERIITDGDPIVQHMFKKYLAVKGIYLVVDDQKVEN